MSTLFQYAPLLPFTYVTLLLALALGVAVIAKLKRSAEFYWRGGLILLFTLYILHPVIINEIRQALPDKLLVVLDESPSQTIAARDKTAEKALARLKDLLTHQPNLDPVIIHAGLDGVSLKNENTSLFASLRDALMTIPTGQVAGTILITDGQVHDVPAELGMLEKIAPFHAILTGKKNEFDRKVSVVESPKYGLLNQDITVKIKVEDIGIAPQTPIVLNVSQDGKILDHYTVTAGAENSYTFKIPHAGQNVFEFSVAPEAGELTAVNNTAAVIVNGIRDRLRVLLVSGMPHTGERAWRDLLKSDPSIDLVHFTILRSPMSFDATPPREMALIAFPVDELFEKKINDFDLIIFDKYVQYGLLQQQYFLNIASFVKQGGAFLMAMGSDVSEQSIYATPLADILPVEPKPEDSSILTQSFLPRLTDIGKTHPVTGDLQTDKQPWGKWETQSDVIQTKGQALMSGINDRPLLILDKVSDGRVAVLTSDNIWLWSKNIDGGGPYTELLRRTAHWLMKEPELDENYIKAEVKGTVITVRMRDLSPELKTVKMTAPDGKEENIDLTVKEKGWTSAKVIALQNGIYRFANGEKTAFALVGTGLSEEFSDVHTTDEKLKPVVTKTKGAMIWYNETPDFTLRRIANKNGSFGGNGWMGLKENSAYSVGSVESAALIPEWLALFALFGGLVFVWWREGKK